VWVIGPPMKGFGGLYHCAKFGWNRSGNFDDMQVLVFCDFGLKTPIHARFWGTFPPKNVIHCSDPKKVHPWADHVICGIRREYRPRGSSWALEREKKDKTGQGKKSQKGYISPIWGEAPTQVIYIKNCVVGEVLDVIMCAKFQLEIFRGYHSTEGRIFHFPIDI